MNMTHEQFQQRYRYNPATDMLGEGGFGKVFNALDINRPLGSYECYKVKRRTENGFLEIH